MPRARMRHAARVEPGASSPGEMVGRRSAALERALVAAGAPGLLATYDMQRGGHADRLFKQAVMESGFGHVDSGAWPHDGAFVAGVRGELFREGTEAFYRLPDGTLAHVAMCSGWVRVSLAADATATTTQALSMFQALYPPTYLSASDNRVPITFWMNGRYGPERRLRMIDASPWADIERNYTATVRDELGSVMADFEPGKGGLLLLWQGPPGTGKCVAAGTRVVTAWGYHRIEDMHPARTPDTAWDFAAEVGTPDGLKRTSHFYVGGRKPTKIIRTKQGYEVEGTHEHPLLALRPSGRIEWTRCDELTTSDYVCVARNIEAWGEEAVPDAYILGAFVGDGHIKSGRRAILTTADPELADIWAAFAERHGGKATLRGKYDWSVESVGFIAHLGRCGVKAVLSPDKSIPDAIWRASRSDVAAFLRGLFDADAGVDSRGCIEYCSASEELAREVQLLLLKFGIIGSRRRRSTSHIVRGERRRGKAWRLTLTGDDALKFFGEIGFGLVRKQEMRERLPATRNTNVDIIPYIRDRLVGHRNDRDPSYPMLTRLAEKHPEILADATVAWSLRHRPFWSRVESIADGEAEVFDLTVPDGHAFIANGVVSHNTWALRALVSEWLSWAEFHYITDPDAFFVESASYMVDVLLSESYQEIDEPSGAVVEGDPQGKWRVLILEDTGELLSAKAKEKYGQGLSRLLNVVDGLIGQGLRVLVLVTTNDELGELNAAVRRPGRCASQIVFAPMTDEEAADWLGQDVEEGATLADLYARAGAGTDALDDEDAEAPAGLTASAGGDVVADVRAVAAAHAPEGGCGETSWNVDDASVFWVCGDWSTEEEVAAARDAFLAVDGVDAFESEAESAPRTGDGWELVWPEPGSEEAYERVLALARRPLDLGANAL